MSPAETRAHQSSDEPRTEPGWYGRLDLLFNGTLTEDGGRRRVPRQWAIPFFVLLHFLILGPMPWLTWHDVPLTDLQALVYVVGLVVVCIPAATVVGHVFKTSMVVFVLQFVIVTGGMLVFLVALFSGHLDPVHPTWLGANPPHILFPHIWLPMAMWVFIVAALARYPACWVVAGLRAKLKQAADTGNLAKIVEALWKYEKPEPYQSWRKNLYDAATTPVEILFPPALFIVLLDPRYIQHWTNRFWGNVIYSVVAVLLAVLAYGALVAAERHNWVAALRLNIRRILWYGGSWLTTVLVIVLAGCWLFEVSYVTTVMQGSRPVIVFLILAIYGVFWTYEYWANHTYGEELLTLLGTVHDKLYVDFGPYRVCVFGAAKLSIVKQADANVAAKPGPVLERSELFDQIFAGLGCPELSQELKGTAKMYFTGLNIAIAAPVLVCAVSIVFFEFPTRIPVAEANLANDNNRSKQRDMAALLFQDNDTPRTGRPQVVLIAASGGGTRAALYTSSALDGLRLKGHIKKVKAVSGVSGGGAALAYFAAHHKTLCAADTANVDHPAWNEFHEVMAYRYFVDVLRSSPEFRVPWHTSLSMLLPESFERQFYKETDADAVTELGESGIGVIFNTTLAAESPPVFELRTLNGKEWTNPIQPIKLTDEQIRRSKYASSQFAGSRLIFTNLIDFPKTFPRGDKDYPWNEILRYVVINDPQFKLTRAASLNANFPPVFPNAPVDVVKKDGLHRYWVTDGGAEENRGQFSLLFAVRDAIERQIQMNRFIDPAKDDSVLPDIHLVVVEASGGGVEYKQDNGIAANANAPQKLANQLAIELTHEIQGLYAQLHAQRKQKDAKDPAKAPAFATHFLPMPSAFRIDGGVGTHWMLPESVRLGPPTVDGIDTESDVYANRETIKALIRGIHNPAYAKKYAQIHPEAEDAREKLVRWADLDPLLPTHTEMWRALEAALNR